MPRFSTSPPRSCSSRRCGSRRWRAGARCPRDAPADPPEARARRDVGAAGRRRGGGGRRGPAEGCGRGPWLVALRGRLRAARAGADGPARGGAPAAAAWRLTYLFRRSAVNLPLDGLLQLPPEIEVVPFAWVFEVNVALIVAFTMPTLRPPLVTYVIVIFPFATLPFGL